MSSQRRKYCVRILFLQMIFLELRIIVMDVTNFYLNASTLTQFLLRTDDQFYVASANESQYGNSDSCSLTTRDDRCSPVFSSAASYPT